MIIPVLLSDVMSGHRLTEDEAVLLLTASGRDVHRIASVADEMREQRVGDTVTYVRNQNLHVTNICKNLCGFCGFGRKAGDEGVSRARVGEEGGVSYLFLSWTRFSQRFAHFSSSISSSSCSSFGL